MEPVHCLKFLRNTVEVRQPLNKISPLKKKLEHAKGEDVSLDLKNLYHALFRNVASFENVLSDWIDYLYQVRRYLEKFQSLEHDSSLRSLNLTDDQKDLDVKFRSTLETHIALFTDVERLLKRVNSFLYDPSDKVKGKNDLIHLLELYRLTMKNAMENCNAIANEVLILRLMWESFTGFKPIGRQSFLHEIKENVNLIDLVCGEYKLLLQMLMN